MSHNGRVQVSQLSYDGQVNITFARTQRQLLITEKHNREYDAATRP
jgi:hypothetical protein